MLKLDSLTAFIAVAETGSITEAARRLALSKSVISERLAELERMLGVRLVQRTTRRQSLTEDGKVFLRRAQLITREVQLAADEIADRKGQLVGPLRISAPVTFGYLHLGPALYPFLQKYPGIELTLDLDDRFVDVEAEGYDAVLRHGPVLEGWLVVSRIAPSRRMLVAAPAYLAQAGTPATLDELSAHRGILYTNRVADWRFGRKGKSGSASPRQALRVNNGLVMRDAAVAGMGIALLPAFMVYQEVRRGELVVVDAGVEPEGAEIYMCHPKGHAVSAKLRAVVAHLKAAFGKPPYWDLP